MKRDLLAAIVVSALLSATAIHAQSADATAGLTFAGVETTAQPTPDATAEATDHPSFIARLRHWVRDSQLFERMNGDANGWYPRIGGVTRGSGFAAGPGYRVPLFNDAMLADFSAALSTKKYAAVDAKLRVLQARSKRVELWTELRVENFPQEDYFGLGMTTSEATRTSYDFDSTDVRLRWLVRPRQWARITTTVGYERLEISRGEDLRYPSVDDLFTDATAPGLLEQPDFLHATVTGEIDYRDTGGNTSRGGFYRVAYGRWNDVTMNDYDFHRLDVHAAQFVPLTPSGAHVLSGRVGATSVNSDNGGRVPFYFLAYAGGMDTIRSVREYRYKDHDAVWFSGEYKWRPTAFFSVSAFADLGQVSPDWHSLRPGDMKAGYGAGVAVHSKTQTILRVDVGTGAGEGWQCFIKLRPLF